MIDEGTDLEQVCEEDKSAVVCIAVSSAAADCSSSVCVMTYRQTVIKALSSQ